MSNFVTSREKCPSCTYVPSISRYSDRTFCGDIGVLDECRSCPNSRYGLGRRTPSRTVICEAGQCSQALEEDLGAIRAHLNFKTKPDIDQNAYFRSQQHRNMESAEHHLANLQNEREFMYNSRSHKGYSKSHKNLPDRPITMMEYNVGIPKLPPIPEQGARDNKIRHYKSPVESSSESSFFESPTPKEHLRDMKEDDDLLPLCADKNKKPVFLMCVESADLKKFIRSNQEKNERVNNTNRDGMREKESKMKTTSFMSTRPDVFDENQMGQGYSPSQTHMSMMQQPIQRTPEEYAALEQTVMQLQMQLAMCAPMEPYMGCICTEGGSCGVGNGNGNGSSARRSKSDHCSVTIMPPPCCHKAAEENERMKEMDAATKKEILKLKNQLNKLDRKDRIRSKKLNHLKQREKTLCSQLLQQKEHNFTLSQMVTEAELEIAELRREPEPQPSHSEMVSQTSKKSLVCRGKSKSTCDVQCCPAEHGNCEEPHADLQMLVQNILLSKDREIAELREQVCRMQVCCNYEDMAKSTLGIVPSTHSRSQANMMGV